MASKRRIRRRACTGKQRHADEQGAQAHVRSLYAKGIAGRRAYRCKFCGGYHVGREW